MLKFFRRGATFIQGGTSIPESRVLLSNAFTISIKQLQHVLEQDVSEVADSLLGGFVAPCLVDIKEARSHPQNLTLDDQFFKCIINI